LCGWLVAYHCSIFGALPTRGGVVCHLAGPGMTQTEVFVLEVPGELVAVVVMDMSDGGSCQGHMVVPVMGMLGCELVMVFGTFVCFWCCHNNLSVCFLVSCL